MHEGSVSANSNYRCLNVALVNSENITCGVAALTIAQMRGPNVIFTTHTIDHCLACPESHSVMDSRGRVGNLLFLRYCVFLQCKYIRKKNIYVSSINSCVYRIITATGIGILYILYIILYIYHIIYI
jgi:hypothetical protein